MKFIAKKIKNFIADEQGATAVEYGIFVALIAAIIVVTVKAVGNKVLIAFQTVNNSL